MSLGVRYILLRKQLNSDKIKMCDRCNLPYDEKRPNCPHCNGLSDRQVEELIENQKEIQTGSILYIFLFWLPWEYYLHWFNRFFNTPKMILT